MPQPLPDPLMLLYRPSLVTVIVGPTGSGKTKTLTNLSAATPRQMRYVTSTALLRLSDDALTAVLASTGDQVIESLTVPPYGDGIRRACAIIENVNGVTPNSVILIDDIETTMHPILTRAITQYVLGQATAVNAPTFFVTHSLLVLDSVLDFFPPQGANVSLLKMSQQLPYEVINEVRLRCLRSPCTDVRLDIEPVKSCC